VQYALLAGPLLSMLDSSIVNVAVEPIARELGASLTVVQWAVSGYLLALGAGLAGTAFLARRFGTLPAYRASVIAFTAASALCALAPDAGVLVGARVVQGLVVAPLLQALVQPLRPDQLGDASTLFNTWQRIAGSFGIGLVAALYATRARTLGPVAALHSAGLVLVALAITGALGALVLPAVRNTAMERS
jgi:MFS family permease